jgi:hypothetical protein
LFETNFVARPRDVRVLVLCRASDERTLALVSG